LSTAQRSRQLGGTRFAGLAGTIGNQKVTAQPAYNFQRPEGLLAHYTDAAAAFEHILPERQLRMSAYHTMRDPVESQDILPMISWMGDPPERSVRPGQFWTKSRGRATRCACWRSAGTPVMVWDSATPPSTAPGRGLGCESSTATTTPARAYCLTAVGWRRAYGTRWARRGSKSAT
jgi:hypothetical protein